MVKVKTTHFIPLHHITKVIMDDINAVFLMECERLSLGPEK